MYPLAWGVSDILRGSSDAALCADLAPLADSHLDGCDLLRCRIIDDGARQVLTTPSATHRLSFSSGEMRVSIAMFLDGQNFDPETKRVMGVAFEIRASPSDLRIGHDLVVEVIASKIIELAKAGQRSPDLLCERALERSSPTAAADLDGE